jgi:hypothetical protein
MLGAWKGFSVELLPAGCAINIFHIAIVVAEHDVKK